MTDFQKGAGPQVRIDDPVAAGAAAFETVRDGGVAIFRTDVGYAIIGHAPAAIERIFSLKKRSAAKPCGCFANLGLYDDLILREDKGDSLVRAVVSGHGLPLSIIAPYKTAHPFIASAPEASRLMATKGETIDLLLNAGPIHDEIARRAVARGMAVFGSSANASLTGSKFRFGDIEDEVRLGVDLAIDSGPTRYSHPDGLGSTIIELGTFRPLRIGIEFETIRQIARKECGIEIAGSV